MKISDVKKKSLSTLLAATLAFTLIPTSALATQSSTSTKQTQTTQQTVKQDDGKINGDTEIKNETKQNETKEHKAKEVDKSKFADPDLVQKEVEALFSAIAFNADPASFVSMYLGGAIQRTLFAIGNGLLDTIGSAVFGGPFGGTNVTANQVAFMLTKLDEKAKVVAAESQDLVDLIRTEAKGSILEDFNKHASLTRGYMASLLGQYEEIILCEDKVLKDSLVAKMNIEREHTLKTLLDEKAILDDYILGTNSLSGKNVFQTFDSFADEKYGLSADSYDIKAKFHLQVQTLMYDLSKYVAIIRNDKRHNAPFTGLINYIEKNNERVTAVLNENGADKLDKSFRINSTGQKVALGIPFGSGKITRVNNYEKYDTSLFGVLFPGTRPACHLSLEGFNEAYDVFRYFSKGRDIQTPMDFKYYVEFYTNADKNYIKGDSFGHRYITEDEFKKALAKKPARMNSREWIERAAGLEKGTCPDYIILGETLKTNVNKFTDTCSHKLYYPTYDTYEEKFRTVVVDICEVGVQHYRNLDDKPTWAVYMDNDAGDGISFSRIYDEAYKKSLSDPSHYDPFAGPKAFEEAIGSRTNVQYFFDTARTLTKVK